ISAPALGTSRPALILGARLKCSSRENEVCGGVWLCVLWSCGGCVWRCVCVFVWVCVLWGCVCLCVCVCVCMINPHIGRLAPFISCQRWVHLRRDHYTPLSLSAIKHSL